MEKEKSTMAAVLKDCQWEFKCLSENTRQKIILTLLTEGPMNVGQITKQTRLSQPAVSHHLKELRLANLVTVHSSGTEKLYEPTLDEFEEKMQRLIDELKKVKDHDN